MIQVETQESSLRFQNFVAEDSNEERRMNLDLLDEVREEAQVKAEAVKRRVERKYNSRIRPTQFRDGDLVMRKVHQYEMKNKLAPIAWRNGRRGDSSHLECHPSQVLLQLKHC